MFVFREMAQTDTDELADKFRQEGVYIAQIKSERFTRTFFRRGRRDSRLNVILALHNDQIIGWSVAIQDSRKFWKAFISHHPLWGMRIILRKLVSYLRNRGVAQNRNQLSSVLAAVDPIENQAILQTCEIASHMDITVVPQYRRFGVASELQQLQLRDLKDKGIRRITASIVEWNNRSVSFHRKRGWMFHGLDGSGWRISKDL